MPNNDYATKGDIKDLRDELRKDLRDSITELRVQLVDQMRDMQTELLRAFHNWARPTEIKLRRGDTPGHVSE